MARPKKTVEETQELEVQELPPETTSGTPEATPANEEITSVDAPRPKDQVGAPVKYLKDANGFIYTANPGLLAKDAEHRAKNNGIGLFTPCEMPKKGK